MSMFIDGQWRRASGDEFVSTNPASGEAVWKGNEATEEDVNLAVSSASEAFKSWSKLSFADRLAVLKKFRELLEEEKLEFAQLISSETGKPYWECQLEVGAMVGKLAHSVNAYAERCPSKNAAAGDAQSVLRFRPIGVMAVYGPFNLPVHLPNGHILPALLAGNTVVFKPSEQTAACGAKMVELLDKSGLPNGVVNLVQGARTTGEALAKSDVNGILFTGSYRVGKILHQQLAGQPEKMLALEMGGNNPLIVWDAVDLKAAAYLTIQSAYITSGQRCVCARRLIIPEGSEGAKFLKELITMIGAITYADPASRPEPFIGPVISETSASMVLASYQELVARGAKVLVEMKQDDKIKALLSPGLIDVTGLDLEDEEVFGPLLQVIRVKNYDAAVDEANNTSFGLSAGLISDRKDLYTKFLNRSRAGIINWNRQITGAVSCKSIRW